MKRVLVLAVLGVMVLAGCAGGAASLATEAAAPGTAPVVVTEAVPDTGVAAGEAAATEAVTATESVAATEAAAGALSGTATFALTPEKTTVTYEVGETFINDNNRFNLAVGQTQGVNGEIQVNFDQPQASSLGPLSVDISGFQSDSGRRDNAIRDRFLQSAQFPTATFTPTGIEGLPGTIEAGTAYTFKVTGDLTIRDTTKPATFDVTAQVDGNTLSGQAVTTFLMSDYGFGPISILGMLNTEDAVKVTVGFEGVRN